MNCVGGTPPPPPKFLSFFNLARFSVQTIECVKVMGKILCRKELDWIFWGRKAVWGGRLRNTREQGRRFTR